MIATSNEKKLIHKKDNNNKTLGHKSLRAITWNIWGW